MYIYTYVYTYVYVYIYVYILRLLMATTDLTARQECFHPFRVLLSPNS